MQRKCFVGANDGGPGRFVADLTSYEYDAPMNEAGDPNSKYYALQSAIGEYLPLPNISIPSPEIKMHIGKVKLSAISVIFSEKSRKHLGSRPLESFEPSVTFEQLNQYSGFVLYEANLPEFKSDPSSLNVELLRDRAYIYLNRVSLCVGGLYIVLFFFFNCSHLLVLCLEKIK